MPSQPDAPLRLRVVTRAGVAFDGAVDSLVVPAWDGLMGIHRDHAPFLGLLRPGRIVARTGSGEQVVPVTGGYIRVRANEVSVIAETAPV
jgi:F-type H+-transporting ATPase subunit epsilon